MNDLIQIQDLIYTVREQKVMLDSGLAQLYVVLTKNLNTAVKRNLDRFPQDFMFQLTKKEFQNLRFQYVTSKSVLGKIRYMPYVYTVQGVAMLSSVLESKQANIGFKSD